MCRQGSSAGVPAEYPHRPVRMGSAKPALPHFHGSRGEAVPQKLKSPCGIGYFRRETTSVFSTYPEWFHVIFLFLYTCSTGSASIFISRHKEMLSSALMRSTRT